MSADSKSGMDHSEIYNIDKMVDYNQGAVVSRTLKKDGCGTVTVFAFDRGEGLSEHAAPFDALVQVIDGNGLFIIDGAEYSLAAGQVIMMPANIPHSVSAVQRFKMILTMIRSK